MNHRYQPEGTLYLTPGNTEAVSSVQGLEKALRDGRICEALCTMCDHELSLHVPLGNVTGIIERDEAVYVPGGEAPKDIAIITRVGKPVCFKVLGLGERNGQMVAYLSRRLAQKACYEEYISRLTPGDILPASVTHLESFGAFVDIGCGISSLLSVDCLSVSRISHPRDRLSCGMRIFVVVKAVDKDLHRVFVSLRELLGTWEQNAARFSAGQTVAGIIRSTEDYGVFIELTPNLAGLAELREHDIIKNDLTPGRQAAVYIKSILPDRMKIKLVLIDTYPAGPSPTPPLYYIDPGTTSHITHWRYSPESAVRITETVFDAV